jgi:hypothetical protein
MRGTQGHFFGERRAPMNKRVFRVGLLVSAIAALAWSVTAMAQNKGQAPASGRTPSADIRGVHGLFALSTGTQPIAPGVWRQQNLAGVSLRGPWTEEEPEEKRFHWTFDGDVAQARQLGKQVILRVSPAQPPAWVFRAGARAFTFTDANPHHKTRGDVQRMAIPWDPVFLAKWTAFIQAFGRRYDNESSVVLIQMAGANKHGGEMHLPSTKTDKENWKKAGYSKEKLVQSYRTIIDAYDQAFPNKLLALDVSPTVFKDGAVEEIAAYASSKLGRRFCIQHNALAAKTNEQGAPMHQLVRSFEGRATLGYQLLCSATGKGAFTEDGKRFGGTLKSAFDIGLRGGASYFEIYTADLENAATARDIHEAALALANRRGRD